jgi:putative transposase
MNSIIRTPLQIIGYGVYLYYLGLSFRNAAKALYFLYHVKISHVSIWNWIQKYKPNKMSSKKKKNIDEYLCIQKDETDIKGGSELIWL